MDSQHPTHSENSLDDSEAFASIRLLISRMDSANSAQEFVDRAIDLDASESQLLVDVLSMALNSRKLLSHRKAHVWFSLIKIATSSGLFARDRTITSDYIRSAIGGPGTIEVVRKSKDASGHYHDALVDWVHLCHPNIQPLYAASPPDEDSLCLVSPCTANTKICEFVRDLDWEKRASLLLGVANGLAYMHQLGVIHGALNPETVLVSGDGRALITNLDISPEEQTIRYSAPELSLEDDSRPTRTSNIWSLACLFHEALSGKIPFCQFSNDFKAATAIGRGDKPARPDQEGRGGKEISDEIWKILLMCWEYNAENRPIATRVLEMLSDVHSLDDRPDEKPSIAPEALETSLVDVEKAKSILIKALGSEEPSAARAPEHLQACLSRLVRDRTTLDLTTAAARKLSPSDTQTLVDVIDLVIQGFPNLSWNNLTGELLRNIAASTFIFPRYFKINGLRYDSTTPIAEGAFSTTYKARGLNVRVHLVSDPTVATNIIKISGYWAHLSHINVFPCPGIFHDASNDSPRVCLISPFLKYRHLKDYLPGLSQNSRRLLVLDIVNGVEYIHNTVSIATGGISGETVLISDEGRAMVATFGAEVILSEGATSASNSAYWDRFMPPSEPSRSNFKDDIWTIGTFAYLVFSRRLPYHQYSDDQLAAMKNTGELPKRPDQSDAETDEIEDEAWDLITKCCSVNPDDQPDLSQIREMITKMGVKDNRPPPMPIFGPEIAAMTSRPDIDFHRAETVLDQIRVEVLRYPLSQLVQNHIKEVAASIIGLEQEDIRTLVNFLDQALRTGLSTSDERNRVLALLARITSSTLVFPQRYELDNKGMLQGPRKYIDEGGSGTVYQAPDPNVCIKLMKRLDTGALTPWIKEVIVWAHSSHPSVLPFLGVFLEGPGDSPQTCLVSPFMKNGNLQDYAPRLPQKSRLPLISDVANGLQYLHNLGIVHGDLKGQNVLISDEGRALITDFGASHITTATAASGSLSTTTLRFSAPEMILGNKSPTKEFDIWSFGCLVYAVLSRKLPYYEYKMEVQIIAALTRKETPKRPGSASKDEEETDEFDWDDDIKQDWDAIDDQAWNLIVKCCAPEPGDRPYIAHVRELVTDLNIWDNRSTANTTPGAEILSLRSDPKVNLVRVEELLDQVQRNVNEHVAVHAEPEPQAEQVLEQVAEEVGADTQAEQVEAGIQAEQVEAGIQVEHVADQVEAEPQAEPAVEHEAGSQAEHVEAEPQAV